MPHPDSGPGCPIAGCSRKRDPDKLMCLPDWRRVPGDLQREVYTTWARRRAGVEGGEQAHEAAKKAAIEAVERRG